jgi:hypothetical protein
MPKEATGVDLRSYATTITAGLATFALATQSGHLIGAAASTWVIAPAIAYYIHTGIPWSGCTNSFVTSVLDAGCWYCL